MTELELRAQNVTNRFSYRYGYLKAKDAYIEGATDTIERALQWLEDMNTIGKIQVTDGMKADFEKYLNLEML